MAGEISNEFAGLTGAQQVEWASSVKILIDSQRNAASPIAEKDAGAAKDQSATAAPQEQNKRGAGPTDQNTNPINYSVDVSFDQDKNQTNVKPISPDSKLAVDRITGGLTQWEPGLTTNMLGSWRFNNQTGDRQALNFDAEYHLGIQAFSRTTNFYYQGNDKLQIKELCGVSKDKEPKPACELEVFDNGKRVAIGQTNLATGYAVDVPSRETTVLWKVGDDNNRIGDRIGTISRDITFHVGNPRINISTEITPEPEK